MYDIYASELIDLLPELPQLNHEDCRRALSAAYFYVVQSRLSVSQDILDNEEVLAVGDLLRRMADALESVAVFDRDEEQNVMVACAFVAAESLAILSMLNTVFSINEEDHNNHRPRLFSDETYATIESALLYMIGGYDINAVALVRDITEPVQPNYETTGIDEIEQWVQRSEDLLFNRILLLCRGQVNENRLQLDFSPINISDSTDQYEALILNIRYQLNRLTLSAVDDYLNWLGGYDLDGRESSLSSLQRVQLASNSSGYQAFTSFAEYFHLSGLLIAAIDSTSQRSVVNSTPPPPTTDDLVLENFRSYLCRRARGSDNVSGRPFFWPSSLQYVDECLPGPHRSAVISMPTGSGKSFIAELAVTHALNSGWVLYLVPTNALANQIRRDLSSALSNFLNSTIRSFVGKEEYTTLASEQLSSSQQTFVAVMTPEKCALALRLHADQFENCSLCIFDECHLLNDSNRGYTVDIVLAQLSKTSKNIKYLLMSAMVSNPNELSEWLDTITFESNAIPLNVAWRPSRTMRGFLVVDGESTRSNHQSASADLSQLPARRKNLTFDAGLSLIAGLSGPWTLDGPSDYVIARLSATFPASASRSNTEPQLNSWKNTASRILAEYFTANNIPTICFLLTSRHHVFSSAAKVVSSIPNALGPTQSFPSIIQSWLAIAERELGLPSILEDLFRKGITAHSSAMLGAEHAASEWMFSRKKAPLMFATATLAQGLNLPAIAVVVAGTTMGDSREQEVTNLARVNGLILNGFGRASRPGFANQGVAVLVSDEPYWASLNSEIDGGIALERYPVLGESDATIEVQSPIGGFLDRLHSQQISIHELSNNELVLTSLLTEMHESENGTAILDNTFAAYQRQYSSAPDTNEYLKGKIDEFNSDLNCDVEIPVELNQAAMKSGVSYQRAFYMWNAFRQIDFVVSEEQNEYSVEEWLQIFIDVISRMPPVAIENYLAPDLQKTETVLTLMRDSVSEQRNATSSTWDMTEQWHTLWLQLMNLTLQYMRGESYSSIAQSYLNLNKDKITNARSKGDQPLPSVFKLISTVISDLAIDAGCFLAIYENVINRTRDTEKGLPDSLAALPVGIRNGCNSLATLSWYRFGYRERVCAHALQAAFPMPETLESDDERRNWIVNTRRRWLNGELPSSGDGLLIHIKSVIFE